jgi:hypothetical protein
MIRAVPSEDGGTHQGRPGAMRSTGRRAGFGRPRGSDRPLGSDGHARVLTKGVGIVEEKHFQKTGVDNCMTRERVRMTKKVADPPWRNIQRVTEGKMYPRRRRKKIAGNRLSGGEGIDGRRRPTARGSKRKRDRTNRGRVRIGPGRYEQSVRGQSSKPQIGSSINGNARHNRQSRERLCVFIEHFPSGVCTTSSNNPPPSASNPECTLSTHSPPCL